MNFKNLLIFLLCMPLSIYSEQFVYPVAAIDQEGKEILVVYQKSLDDIELWVWNSTTKRAIKGLLSMYIPAGIKMLPSGAGFSFIDEGRLRVKNFYKRLPKTIAIYEPISKITDIHWISDDAFYFSAREGEVYNIFSSNTLGEVQRCTSGQDSDYVYPCKIGKAVFCIERAKNKQFFNIVKIQWQLCAFDSEVKNFESKENVFTTSQPISYLNMISDEEGFYLDYGSICSDDLQNLLSFTCCRIFKDSTEAWSTEKLFEFKVPYLYVIGKEKERLYESIAPLLPHYTNSQFIYYIDAHADGFFELKKYDKRNKNIETLKSNETYSKIISPLRVGNILYAGFVIHEKEMLDCMLDPNGSMFLNLPELSIKD